MNIQMVTTYLQTLFEPGDVFEIRVLEAVLPGSTWPHTESGYFDYDHIDDVPNGLANFKTYAGVYVTLNPVNPDLLARANNRFKKARNREATGDKDILRRRWLLVDIDPVRPAGISATESEKSLAFDKAIEIANGLSSMDWPRPMVVDSGNGTQLFYRIDLSADDGGLVQRCLQALQPCSTDDVHVDLSVHNAARIGRLPGTWNRKGDSTENRPHRIAEIMELPAEFSIVSAEKLHALAGDRLEAGDCRRAEEDASSRLTPPVSSLPADDYNHRGEIASILEKHGWTLKSESDQQYWLRPGKTNGQHSATYNGEVFYVWSDNAAPFAAHKGYSRFGVYTMLEHDGDFAQAVRKLRQNGYGGPTACDVGPCADISGILAQGGEQDITSRKRRFIRFDQIEIHPPDWLLRGILERDSTAMIFGDPGCGKSFVAIDWACRIATGTPWRGHTVKPAPVAYILGEGQGGLGRRIHAWQTHNGVSLSDAPIYMARAVALPDRSELEQLIDDIGREIGKPELVVLDTLARNFGCGDENSTQDMSQFVAACDRIREHFNCTILIVHHSGHGDKNRARGAMALKAALDAEYRLTQSDRLLLTATKMKDAETPDPLTIDLINVELPGIIDDYGKPVTSAAIEVVDAEISGIVNQCPDVAVEDFVKHCIEPYDPCSKSIIQHHASRLYGLPAQRGNELLNLAMEQEHACRVSTGSGSKYVARRPGCSGEKSLWAAALLVRDVNANAKSIAEEVGVTRQYVNQVRRSLFGTDMETQGGQNVETEWKQFPCQFPEDVL